jgi:hypothetical protein
MADLVLAKAARFVPRGSAGELGNLQFRSTIFVTSANSAARLQVIPSTTWFRGLRPRLDPLGKVSPTAWAWPLLRLGSPTVIIAPTSRSSTTTSTRFAVMAPPRSLWDGNRRCGARSRQKSRDEADDHRSARSSTGPVCRLKFSAQLIKPTWL